MSRILIAFLLLFSLYSQVQMPSLQAADKDGFVSITPVEISPENKLEWAKWTRYWPDAAKFGSDYATIVYYEDVLSGVKITQYVDSSWCGAANCSTDVIDKKGEVVIGFLTYAGMGEISIKPSKNSDYPDIRNGLVTYKYNGKKGKYVESLKKD